MAKKSKKKAFKKHVAFGGRMVMIGFGSIGQGVLPLIFRHIDIKPEQITIISAEDRGGLKETERYGVKFIKKRLTQENFRQVLDKRVGKGDFLVNLSVEVASTALVEFCQEKGALYIDTCIEPWPGGYTDPNLSVSRRSNYALRETMLALKPRYEGGPTAVIAHGANPGLVSHFVKQALVNLAKDTGLDAVTPTTREGWGQLARDLGVKVIHIAERDTQVSKKPKKVGEFVNTWSIDGFVSEGGQPAEMGWGTHEKLLPSDGARHDFGCGAAIYLNRPGLVTRVRTWTPLEGPFHGFIITHNESISMADYFTLRDGEQVTYRPTVHYAYHPCDQAIMSMHEMRREEPAPAEEPAPDRRGDHRGPRRARRAADGPREGHLLVRQPARHPRGAQARALQQRDLDPGLRAGALGHHLGAREPGARHRRGRRDGFRAQPRDLHALSRPGRRQVRRLDPAAGSRPAVLRGPRHRRSLAVHELPGDVTYFGEHRRCATLREAWGGAGARMICRRHAKVWTSRSRLFILDRMTGEIE